MTDILIETTQDEPLWHDLTVLPKTRVTRKGNTTRELPEELRGWIKLGTPIVAPVGDPVTQGDTHRFAHVQLAVSLRPGDEEPFQSVWLKVQLSRESRIENDASPPIAWSLHPKTQSSPVEVTTKLKLNGSLKFSGVGIGTDQERDQKFTHNEVHLEAFNDLRSDPVWEFRGTELTPIRGAHRLHMIVRYEKGTACRGNVKLEATIQRKRWGLIEYTAALDGLEATTFMLPR